jgi:hypothetical protein
MLQFTTDNNYLVAGIEAGSGELGIYKLALSGTLPVNQEYPGKELNFFPVPVIDVLEISGIEGNAWLELYSLHGVLLKIINIQNGSIDLSDMQNGLYLLKIYSGNNTLLETRKIIKE